MLASGIRRSTIAITRKEEEEVNERKTTAEYTQLHQPFYI